MNAPLEHYRNEFRCLSGRDRSGDFDGLSLGGARHQPVVLLMILDLYAQDPRRHNLIEPGGLWRELWTIYKELLGIAVGSPLEMPLYALRSGVRLQASNGHIMVEAAPIVSWSESHDDRPVNALSLCPLCHWTFDKYLFTLDLNLQILTHARIQSDNNVPVHFAALGGRSIFRPREDVSCQIQSVLKNTCAVSKVLI